MNAKKKIVQLLVILSFSLSGIVIADDSPHGRAASRNDRDHEHGERNFGPRFKEIENGDAHRFGTPVQQLRAGTPRPSDRVFYDYQYYNEVMRDHR